MSTSKTHAGLADVAMPPPFASANVLMSAYADMVRMAFEITHELTVEAMTLMHRATEYWLTQEAHYRADVAALGPWTPLMGSGPVAEDQPDAEGMPSPREDGVDHHNDGDDDKCCGDACTSKACKRVLKSLELAASDFSLTPFAHRGAEE